MHFDPERFSQTLYCGVSRPRHRIRHTTGSKTFTCWMFRGYFAFIFLGPWHYIYMRVWGSGFDWGLSGRHRGSSQTPVGRPGFRLHSPFARAAAMSPPIADPSAALPPAPSALTLATPVGSPLLTLAHYCHWPPVITSGSFRQTVLLACSTVRTLRSRLSHWLRHAADPETFGDPRSWYQVGRLPTRHVSSW
jgi:hypothetical protein